MGIKEPNPKTGYRGIHLIYRYKSERSKDYNGLRTEIQIRTKLQHLWATSVETVGLFTGEGLKFSQGSDEWLEFFRLVSELFAIEESLAPEKYTAEYKGLLAAKIMNLDIKLDAIHKMQTIGVFSTRVGHINHNNVNGQPTSRDTELKQELKKSLAQALPTFPTQSVQVT